jgi:hypothetical protein
MEIYNEHLTDLLGAKDENDVLPKVDLREHPKKASPFSKHPACKSCLMLGNRVILYTD